MRLSASGHRITDQRDPALRNLTRVAVILNRHARGVSPRQIERLTRLHPEDDIFVSTSVEHSRHIARTVVERGYDRVLLGGGDGTFVRCVTDLDAEARRANVPLPGVGVLRLGTGNAVGFYLGAKGANERGLRADLLRARGQDGGLRPLHLMRVNGKLTPFAGTGLDSQILEDYSATTQLLDQVRLGSLFSSPLRYALAVAFRSIPRFLFRRLPVVEARNVGGPAFQVGPDGRPDPTPLPAGTVLYRGPCTLAGAATIPCYGFNVRIFPYADLLPGKFHLRCTDASAFETLAHLPAVLRGSYRSPTIRDFLCDSVELRLSQPVPMQVGGDLQGERSDFMRIEMGRDPVSCIGS
jgi:diacylglycerol kinase family enzyme